MTACSEIRARHTSCLSMAIIIAVAMHAVAFALWPTYVPRAYRPRIVIPQIVDPEYDIEIPPKPREIALTEVPLGVPASTSESYHRLGPGYTPRVLLAPGRIPH
jgi:hypothetical protein